MGFEHVDFVEPSNHSGGLAVLLNNGIVRALVIRKEQQAIHMLVLDLANESFGFSFGLAYFRSTWFGSSLVSSQVGFSLDQLRIS